jgi:hypothetical protein
LIQPPTDTFALGAVRGFDVENRFYGDLNLMSWSIDQ